MTAGPGVLARESRLCRGGDIDAVSRSSARARADDVSVAVRVRPQGGSPRACVVVGKRAGGAVERNRQRRRLQHVLAEMLPGLPAGADLVVRGGPAVAAQSPEQLRRNVRRTLGRALGRMPHTADGS